MPQNFSVQAKNVTCAWKERLLTLILKKIIAAATISLVFINYQTVVGILLNYLI